MIISLPTAVVTDDKLVVLSIRVLLRRDTAHLLEDSARGGCQLPESPVASSVHPDALVILLSTISCLGNGWNSPTGLHWDCWIIGSYLLISFAG